jgi:hypothetical protein
MMTNFISVLLFAEWTGRRSAGSSLLLPPITGRKGLEKLFVGSAENQANFVPLRANRLYAFRRPVHGGRPGGDAAAQGGVSKTTGCCAHIYLIPRRDGDTPDPTGGVRGLIPGRMHYRRDVEAKAE